MNGGGNGKILILSCGTGEGHNSCAQAIERALSEKGVSCRTLDVLSFKSERAKNRASSVYSAVIRHIPAFFGFVYKLGRVYDRSKLPSPIYSMNASYAGKLYGYLTENAITSVICTHLFAMEAMTAVKRKYGFGKKCYGVLTDYTAIPFYKDTDLDGYFVADKTVGGQLVNCGINGSKIFISGIPVNSKFSLSVCKAEAREILDLPADKKLVAVMAGGAGCGKVIKLVKRLDKKLGDDCAVLVFSGRNDKLKASVERRAEYNERIKVISFTDNVHLYMKACVVLVSKAGGLSCTEAAVAGIPIVHLKAIPGQENANMKKFSHCGMSISTKTVKKAVNAVNYLLDDVQCAQAMVKIQKLFISANSTNAIVNFITEDNADGLFTLSAVYNGGLYFGRDNVQQDYSEAVLA